MVTGVKRGVFEAVADDVLEAVGTGVFELVGDRALGWVVSSEIVRRCCRGLCARRCPSVPVGARRWRKAPGGGGEGAVSG